MSALVERPSMSIMPRQDSFALLAPAAELAEKISQTEFVPTAMRNRPAAIVAAILMGNEAGLPPMTSLSHIHVIEGRPTLDAFAMRALILSHGHELWWDDMTVTRCTLLGRRRGSEHVTSVTWTLDDARRANLANKQVWRSYPRAMLMARCTGEMGRAIFADVLGGIAYTTEELEDGVIEGRIAESPEPPTEPTHTSSAGPVKRRARRAVVSPTEPPEPPAIDMTPEPIAESAQGPEVSAAEPSPEGGMPLNQQIAMHCREAGIERKTLIKAITGAERGSDLTREQAVDVLEAAKAIARGEKQLLLIGDNWTVIGAEEQPH